MPRRNHRNQKMSKGKLACPAKCGRPRRAGHLLCRQCWDALPRRNQIEVSAAWKAAHRDLKDERRWQDYLRARRVALAALR